LTAVPVLGSGQAFQPPPTPPPPPGGSGNDIAYTASLNNPLNIDMPVKAGDPNNPNAGPSKRLSLKPLPVDNSKILAIMDTGLDTSYFSQPMAEILWSDPNKPTLRNFTFNNPVLSLDYFEDDHPGKHGTGVTGIAINSLGQTPRYPRIMVLKVLDNAETGTTFNVSCALSYAVQQHATLVNASLGYYNLKGDIDSVLLHYANLCNSNQADSIFVFSAAGNLPNPHTGKFCSTPSSGNELVAANGISRLFYPACFSDRLPNIISITGLLDLTSSCFYQNYSSKYVSAGVLNTIQNCCTFPIPSMNLAFEGSSFSTPVASGQVMGCLLNTAIGSVRSARQCITSLTQTSASLKGATVNGTFFDNRGKQQ
jgi:subtilisin family serine protease